MSFAMRRDINLSCVLNALHLHRPEDRIFELMLTLEGFMNDLAAFPGQPIQYANVVPRIEAEAKELAFQRELYEQRKRQKLAEGLAELPSGPTGGQRQGKRGKKGPRKRSDTSNAGAGGSQ